MRLSPIPILILSGLMAVFAFILDTTAEADCRPPQTLTQTDFSRMTEATDDFIEGNYIQANVAWTVGGETHVTPAEVTARLYVGKMSTLYSPGEVDFAKAKLYDIVLSRECAADHWTVSSFVKAK